jgi:CheY-like chemotaxis protein
LLVIEDNRESADSLCRLLRLWGHEATAAYDGDHGLRLAAALRPDCALIDLGMPGVSGYEVARRLRRDPALASLTLVALTGYSESPYRVAAAEAGFDHFLVKSTDPSQLKALLDSLPRGEVV